PAETVYDKVYELGHDAHYTVAGISIGLFILGVVLAGLFFTRFGPFYGRQLIRSGPLAWLENCLKNLWYVDRILVGCALGIMHLFRKVCGAFDSGIVDGFVNLWGTICQFITAIVGAVDYGGVDGTVRGIGESALRGGRWVRKMQNGLLQVYLYASVFLFAGVVLVSIYLIWKQTQPPA
ncbi:MAG: hypothetical protein AAF517_17345, partial [Planctomycetota bacterium]